MMVAEIPTRHSSPERRVTAPKVIIRDETAGWTDARTAPGEPRPARPRPSLPLCFDSDWTHTTDACRDEEPSTAVVLDKFFCSFSSCAA
jgi:hypothetical protein